MNKENQQTPKMEIRYSVEGFARKYPEKTGAELLELHAMQEAGIKLKQSFRNRNKIAFIEDLKYFGGYFRANRNVNGSNIQFYFDVKNPRLSEEVVFCDVEIISFLFENGSTKIQKSIENNVNVNDLYLVECERLHKANYEVVVEQLDKYIESSKIFQVQEFKSFVHSTK